MSARWFAATALSLLLGGCGGDRFEDLERFMESAGQGGSSKIEPLPPVRQVETFEYRQGDLTDPFMPRNLRPVGGHGGLQPDLSRPPQPLEEFPLDALRLVGSITRPGKPLRALVKDPKDTVYTVKVGDHIGQNYGVVTKITSDRVEIRELVQDSAGEWLESPAMMTLAEQ